MLPRGLEPRTLRLLAVRSDQLSYKSQRVELPSASFQSLVLEVKEKIGEPGHRSQCLSHAKRALYHLS